MLWWLIIIIIAWVDRKNGNDLDQLQKWLKQYPFGSGNISAAEKTLNDLLSRAQMSQTNSETGRYNSLDDPFYGID